MDPAVIHAPVASIMATVAAAAAPAAAQTAVAEATQSEVPAGRPRRVTQPPQWNRDPTPLETRAARRKRSSDDDGDGSGSGSGADDDDDDDASIDTDDNPTYNFFRMPKAGWKSLYPGMSELPEKPNKRVLADFSRMLAITIALEGELGSLGAFPAGSEMPSVKEQALHGTEAGGATATGGSGSGSGGATPTTGDAVGGKKRPPRSSAAASTGPTRSSSRIAAVLREHVHRPPRFYNGENTCFLEDIIMLLSHLLLLLAALSEDAPGQAGANSTFHHHGNDEIERMQCLVCNVRVLLAAAAKWTVDDTHATLTGDLTLGDLMQRVANEVRSMIRKADAAPTLSRTFLDEGGALFLDESPTRPEEIEELVEHVRKVNGGLPATQEDAQEAAFLLLDALREAVGRRALEPLLTITYDVAYCPHGEVTDTLDGGLPFSSLGSAVFTLQIPSNALALLVGGVLPLDEVLKYTFARRHNTDIRDSITACGSRCDSTGDLPVVGCRGSSQRCVFHLEGTTHLLLTVLRLVAVDTPAGRVTRKVVAPIELPTEMDLSPYSGSVHEEAATYYLDPVSAGEASSLWRLVGYGIHAGGVRSGHYTTWHRHSTDAATIFLSNGSAVPRGVAFGSPAELTTRGQWYTALFERKK